jgi:hypothetical protein
MSIHREYKTRIGSVARRVRERTNAFAEHVEQRTSNTIQKISQVNNSKEDAASTPKGENISSAQDDTLLSPLNGERNEVRGFDETQMTEATEGSAAVFESASSPRSAPPFHGGEGDEFVWLKSSALPNKLSPENANPSIERSTFSEFSEEPSLAGTPSRGITARVPAGGTGEPLASITPHVAPLTAQAHRPYPGDPEHRAPAPGTAAVSAASAELRRVNDTLSEHARNHVTRQELQRELDSLRRLMETRK